MRPDYNRIAGRNAERFAVLTLLVLDLHTPAIAAIHRSRWGAAQKTQPDCRRPFGKIASRCYLGKAEKRGE
jgi:hypothetical protein